MAGTAAAAGAGDGTWWQHQHKPRSLHSRIPRSAAKSVVSLCTAVVLLLVVQLMAGAGRISKHHADSMAGARAPGQKQRRGPACLRRGSC